MKKLIITAGLAAVLTVSGVAAATNSPQPKYEKPTITKAVKNVTSGTDFMPADTLETAVVAHTGDVLIYQVKVTGNAWNYKTEDVLPEDVELVNKVVTNYGHNLDITVKVTGNDVPVQNTACLVYEKKSNSSSVSENQELSVQVLDKSKRHPRHKEDICNDAWIQVHPVPVPSTSPSNSPTPTPTSSVVTTQTTLRLPDVGGTGRNRP